MNIKSSQTLVEEAQKTYQEVLKIDPKNTSKKLIFLSQIQAEESQEKHIYIVQN